MQVPRKSHRTASLLILFSGYFQTVSMNAQSTIFYTEDFESDNGAYVASVETPGGGSPDIVNPWLYNTDGVGGSQGWSTDGGRVGTNPGSGGIPFEMWLTSPDIAVTSTGEVTLQFDHSFDFELEQPNTYWDGGVVMISVNDGAFINLDATAFSQNGYNGTIQSDFDWGYTGDLNGQDVFGGDSGGYITSIASLGTLNVGDTLNIRFRGGWDWFAIAGGPNWAVDNIQLSSIPEPATVVLLSGAIALLIVGVRKRVQVKRAAS